MAGTPNSFEVQIDNFLEQFKRSASKAMDCDWVTATSTTAGTQQLPQTPPQSSSRPASIHSSNSIGSVDNPLDAPNSVKTRSSCLDIAALSLSVSQCTVLPSSMLSVEETDEKLRSSELNQNDDNVTEVCPVQQDADNDNVLQSTNTDDDGSDTVDVEITDPDDFLELDNFDTTELLGQKSKIKKPQQKPSTKKRLPDNKEYENETDRTELETSASQVGERFGRGCECHGSCYKDLQAEQVYRHRLNIAELTKEEHDMYLMGVTMACLANRKETYRHKERVRQRASYVYQGKRVCLDAFLYLENVTQYHLKRIRSHVMKNGVVPRVHGNVRKKPHNTLSLDMYKSAENFFKSILSNYSSDTSKPIFVMDETRVGIYQKFKQSLPAGGKVMGYSTFRHFLKQQFPNVRFSTKSLDVHSTKYSQNREVIARRIARSAAFNSEWLPPVSVETVLESNHSIYDPDEQRKDLKPVKVDLENR